MVKSMIAEMASNFANAEAALDKGDVDAAMPYMSEYHRIGAQLLRLTGKEHRKA